MTVVKLSTLLKKANKNNFALAGLVVLGWEDALAFTQAADEIGIPIILQHWFVASNDQSRFCFSAIVGDSLSAQ